jgi:hypothetical protein
VFIKSAKPDDIASTYIMGKDDFVKAYKEFPITL